MIPAPKRKIAVGALAGAIVAIAVWAARMFFGVDEPPEVAAAEVVIISAIASYIVPEGDQA